MKSAVRTTALVVMPLATAVNMQAAPMTPSMLPTGPMSCYTSGDGGGGSCSGGAAQLETYNNIQGVKLYTDGLVQFLASGGGTSVVQLLIQSGGFAGPGIASGTVIPLSYSFELGLIQNPTDSVSPIQTDTGSIGDWWLYFGFYRNDQYTQIGTARADGSGAGAFSGTTSMTTLADLPGGSTVDLEVMLWANWSTIGWADSLTINIPQNSMDFNAVPDDSGVPEPASMALLASGLALLGWRVCRRRRA